MTDLTTGVTMPLVWATAAKTSGTIAGFTTSDFILYYLCMLLLGSFITSHMMWDIAMEIKEGQFSAALVRPVNYFHYTFFRNLAWRIIRTSLFAPVFVLLLWAYSGYLHDARVYLGWEFWVSVLLGHLVSFTFIYMMAMLALFVQEVYSIFELYYIPMLFLSGQLFPIAVLPGWAGKLARAFPFYFTTGAPTEMLVGRIAPGDRIGILLWQLGWVAFATIMAKILWKRGLRAYTGVGM